MAEPYPKNHGYDHGIFGRDAVHGEDVRAG